ncbi:MAG TPA: exosortase H [Blastocatellia bacterium]|nr:exosortase H [Blastocatellia bacterium]
MIAAERIAALVSANRKPLKFVALFALIFGVCYFVFGISPGVREGLIKPYTVILARAVTAIINLFGAGAIADGTLVRSSRYSVSIAMGCDGVEASSLFLAGVMAFPTAWRARLIGLAFGIPAIHLINLLRLVGIYYAGVYLPSIVEEVHIYVAQTIVILFSTALLIFWLERFAIPHRQP